MTVIFSDLFYQRLITKRQCETFFLGTSYTYVKSLYSKTEESVKWNSNIKNNVPEMKQKEI